jgi:hypothetical protein
MCSKFFLAAVEEQGDSGGGRILLGDNTGDEVFMLRPIKSAVLELRISAELPSMYESCPESIQPF